MIVLALTATIAPARAGGWPQPAAGASVSGGPEVIFTFDDGPNPATTGQILDILAARQISAVFFLVGWRFQRGDIAGSRALVARMLSEGHIVGNHSISHANLCAVQPELLDLEISGARLLLERQAQVPIPWFRVPYGQRCPAVEDALARAGYTHFHWDIDPQEWQNRPPKLTAAAVIKELALLEGRAVVLMHDTKAATIFALPEILGWIDAENARRVAVGRPPIRIVSAAELAAERMRPTLAWLTVARERGCARVRRLLAATMP